MRPGNIRRLSGLLIPIGILCATTVYAAMSFVGFVNSAERVPVTLTYRLQHLNPDGIAHLTVDQVFAVNSLGSMVRKRSYVTGDGSIREIRSITDVIAGKRTVIASATSSMTTYHLSESETGNLRNAARNPCPRSDGRPKNISGYRALPDVLNSSGPDGRIVRGVTYFAPELGCMALEAELVVIQPDGTEVVIQRTALLDVSVGEPDPALFDVPSDLEELSPEEYKHRVDQLDGVTTPELEEMPIYSALQASYEERLRHVSHGPE